MTLCDIARRAIIELDLNLMNTQHKREDNVYIDIYIMK